MPKRILLDVGGHFGETVAVALDPAWRFDHVHTFEPDPECAQSIERDFAPAIAQGRLSVHRAALGASDGATTLFGDNGGGGASTVAGALADGLRAIRVSALDINGFLASVTGPDDRLYIKLNCEGGEVEILDRLHLSGRVAAIASIMADFDVVKRGGGYWEKRRIVRLYRRSRIPLTLSEQVMVGRSHAERIANWFATRPELAAGPARAAPRRQLLKRRLRYFLKDMRSAIGLSAEGYQKVRRH